MKLEDRIQNIKTLLKYCLYCGSKLELEKGDIWWHEFIDGSSSPYVTCAACNICFDVEGWKNIRRLY